MLGNRSSQNPNSTEWSENFAGDICKLLLMVILVIFISLGNVVSLLVFFHNKQFRTSQGFLRASLALADLSVGLLGIPYSIYREVRQLAYGMEEETHLFEKPACCISGIVFASCTFASISAIFLLSIERSVAVLKPLHRKVVITKRRTVGLILASWAVSFCLALTPMLSSSNISFQYNSCSKMCNYAFAEGELPTSHWNIMLLYPIFDFSILSGAFITNAITFLTIHQYCKKRKQLGAEQQGSNQLSFSDITAAKTIGIVTFAFSASFLPIAIFVVGSVVGFQWCQFSFYAFWILTSNSCWNVAIYSVWDPKFRQGVWDLFSRQVTISTSRTPSCQLEEHISAPSCIIVFKMFFHPENT